MSYKPSIVSFLWFVACAWEFNPVSVSPIFAAKQFVMFFDTVLWLISKPSHLKLDFSSSGEEKREDQITMLKTIIRLDHIETSQSHFHSLFGGHDRAPLVSSISRIYFNISVVGISFVTFVLWYLIIISSAAPKICSIRFSILFSYILRLWLQTSLFTRYDEIEAAVQIFPQKAQKSEERCQQVCFSA